MDSMTEWAGKRVEKLSKAANDAHARALQAITDWSNLVDGKKPSASVILRYEIWKRKQERKQNGHTNEKPLETSGECDL